MDMERMWMGGLIVVLTIFSGLADGYGFAHAAEIWKEGRFNPRELALTMAGFTCGITVYIVCLRFLSLLGIESAEIQVLFWFSMTLIGVAIFSGTAFTWAWPNQIVAAMVVIGIGWLMVNA